jgi:DNA-binding NtrC family response regulator
MKNGAFDFLPKPLDIRHVQTLTKQALSSKKERLTMRGAKKNIKGMVGRNVSVANILKVIASILPYEGSVLIEGPSGTGKQRIAHTLHIHSARAASPYVTINCAAMPATRIERELFGLHRGSLDNALPITPSKIELAHTGSLFVNNINYLALDLQDRLLDLIEHQACERPGGSGPARADVRIIAAANQNVKTLVDARLFREDLHTRLSVLPLSLPLLYKRGEDIGLLLEHFRKHKAFRNDQVRQDFSSVRPTAMPCDWPSSVREFEHLVGRFCNLHEDQTGRCAKRPVIPLQNDPDAGDDLELKKATRAFERHHILSVLKAVNGSRSQAARRLGIHRNTLLLKTKELGIDFH